MAALGSATFCIPCNYLSLHLPGVFSSILLPHRLILSIFTNAFSVLSYMCISYSSSLMSSGSFASQYCSRKIYSSTDSYPNKKLCYHGSICFEYISLSLGCLINMFPTWKGGGGTAERKFLISSCSLIILLSMLLK